MGNAMIAQMGNFMKDIKNKGFSSAVLITTYALISANMTEANGNISELGVILFAIVAMVVATVEGTIDYLKASQKGIAPLVQSLQKSYSNVNVDDIVSQSKMYDPKNSPVPTNS